MYLSYNGFFDFICAAGLFITGFDRETQSGKSRGNLREIVSGWKGPFRVAGKFKIFYYLV